MPVLELPFQLLYVSRLAADADSGVVAAVTAVSRPRNDACGISGALLFDGERFCQMLEGAETEIRALMARIELDPRHCRVMVLIASHCGVPRLTTRWRSGHCNDTALDVFEATPPASAEVALALFMSALAAAEID